MTARMLAILFSIAALLVAADAAFAQAGSLPVSKGRYRVPYQNGTTVGANNDHTTHPSSLNRIDMGGRGGGPYNIAAAADGWIRIIEDDNTLWCPAETSSCGALPITVCCGRDNAACSGGCRNNYVWMEHANGEWTKYTHFPTNSVTGRGHQVGDFVQGGTVLGQEGRIGLAGGNHLHFEVARPHNGIDSIGSTGFLVEDGDATTDDYNRQNRVPAFCLGGTNGIWLDSTEGIVAANCPADCDAASAPGIVLGAGSVRHLQANVITTGPNHEVLSGAGEALQAQTRVVMGPGFRVRANGYFSANIAGCDAPGSL